MDPQFRIFLSAKPDPSFPISVLHAGINMAVESPKGLKNILLRSFALDGTGLITPNKFSSASSVQRQLFLALCLFNAVCLERSKFGSLGFNLVYEFNDSDLEVSLLQLSQLSATEEVNWTAVHHLIGDISYGGRVTDEWDRRCLKALLSKYQNQGVLTVGHCFTSDGRLHTLNGDLEFDSVRSYLETLPETDSASAFGMGFNAQTAFLESQARSLIDQVLTVQPRMAAAPASDDDEGSAKLVKTGDALVLDLVADIQSRLPRRVEDITEEDVDTRKKLGDKPSLAKSMQADIERVEKELEKAQNVKKVKEDAATLESDASGTSKSPASTPFFTSALHNVLRQEIDRYNILLKLVHQSLRHLRAGIRGDKVMTAELDSVYSALLMNRVPMRWSRYATCKTLGDWTIDLLTRVDVLATWAERLVRANQRFIAGSQPSPADLRAASARGLQTTRPPPALPESETGIQQDSSLSLTDAETGPPPCEPFAFWLPGFFFPQGFITGILQNQARQLGVSVDSLNLEFEVSNLYFKTQEELLDMGSPFAVKEMTFRTSPPSADGALIFGLYVDNACWDLVANCLVDSPAGKRFCKLPEIRFKAVPQPPEPVEEIMQPRRSIVMEPSAMSFIYSCPLYRTSKRAGALTSTGHSTNYVCAIDLPSKQPSSFWVLRGTALLTQPEIE